MPPKKPSSKAPPTKTASKGASGTSKTVNKAKPTETKSTPGGM